MARQVLLDQGVRLTKRKSDDKLRLTLEDITEAVLDPSVKLPTFYAVNLSRIPPIDITHCDISAILLELQALCNEVRCIESLKAEVDKLRSEITSLKESQQWPTLGCSFC